MLGEAGDSFAVISPLRPSARPAGVPPPALPGCGAAAPSAAAPPRSSRSSAGVSCAVGAAVAGAIAAAGSGRRARRGRAARRGDAAAPRRAQEEHQAAKVEHHHHAETGNGKVAAAAEKYLINNYGKRVLAMVRGEGHWLFDADGHKYLDFTSGIAVNCLGHSDPGWAAVVAKQASTLIHTSNLFMNVEQVSLGEKLVKNSFADKAFFCNSGTEANEAAIKFSRKYHKDAGKPREKFVAFQNCFHGRTMGALALTYKEQYRLPFAPLMPSAEFLPYNDVAALEKVDETTCAVFVEPMQGEGGCIPGYTKFLAALRARCDEVGAVLVFDEVQCGLGRTGHLFGYQISGVTPDLLTLAKPLAGGLPIGAVLLTEKLAACIGPGDHGSTFAGAPLVCAAANYTFDRINDKAFLANVCAMGERLRAGLRRFAEPLGLQVRGEGLLNGLIFAEASQCSAAQKAAQEAGLLVLTAGKGNVMRIAPALTVGPAEVDEALAILEKVTKSVLTVVATAAA